MRVRGTETAIPAFMSKDAGLGLYVSPDDYRRNAAECLSIAESIVNPDHRAWLIAIAQSWLLLAHQCEKNLVTEIVYETPSKSSSH
jgi:hypothetical protein